MAWKRLCRSCKRLIRVDPDCPHGRFVLHYNPPPFHSYCAGSGTKAEQRYD